MLGAERIVIVWCETTHPLEPLLASLLAGREVVVPGDCMVREVMLDKRAGTPWVGGRDGSVPWIGGHAGDVAVDANMAP